MKKICMYSIVTILMIFLNACDSKISEEEKRNIIMDDAYVILDKPNLMQKFTKYNEQLLKDFDIDFRVVTTMSESNIDIFSHTEFLKLQTESRSQSGKALLMVVNVSQDKVRLEVSMALEPIYTDAYVSYVERKGIVPYFRDNKISDGIYMMTELIRDRASEAREGREFMPAMESKSIGAGAKAKANIGINDPKAKKGNQITTSSSDAPEDILNKHIYALKTHNKNPDLDIYSDASKAFFKTWTVTDINIDNEYRFINQCNEGRKVQYSSNHQYAVAMNHPEKQRSCSPYFFKKEHGEWKLDIATMAKVLRFNASMKWHFDMDEKNKYLGYYDFAFYHLNYDSNGYPYIEASGKGWKKKYKWGFTCDMWISPSEWKKNMSKEYMNKYGKCFISNLDLEGAAYNKLHLDWRDKIYAIGSGANRVENVSFEQFMDYMIKIKSGDMAYVTVLRSKGTYEPEEKINLSTVTP